MTGLILQQEVCIIGIKHIFISANHKPHVICVWVLLTQWRPRLIECTCCLVLSQKYQIYTEIEPTIELSWVLYITCKAFFTLSKSPRLTKAEGTAIPISPGQTARSRFAPSTIIVSPGPRVPLFTHPNVIPLVTRPAGPHSFAGYMHRYTRCHSKAHHCSESTLGKL